MAQRWLLLYSEPRRAPSPRTVDKQWLKQRERDTKAFQQLCRLSLACEADAQQALLAFAQGLETTTLHQRAVRPMGRYAQRGRPGQDAKPAPVVYQRQGALASSFATREARRTQHSCFILAPNELDEHLWSPQKRFDSDNGQSQAERGFRFLKAPRCFASSRSVKNP